LKEIRIYNLDVNATLDIVRELRAQGLVQGKDFDFSYNKPLHRDWTSWDEVEDPDWVAVPKHAMFRFYDDKYATLFGLKYGSK